ncbi:MAG: hypothetical protein JJU42_08180 [Rhodobacteraceae bacterium]|nr:hypothetical protein [Paracoccaceae bacterium]
MQIERVNQPAALAIPLEPVKAFLRVIGAEDNAQIEAMISAAARELESAAELALLFQTLRVTLDHWPATRPLRLPVGPALAGGPVVTVTADGEPVTATLRPGLRPALVLDGPPQPGPVVIEYQAGFTDTPGALPADIVHALYDQVAVSYDERGANPHQIKASQARGTSGLSYAMMRTIGRYRGVTL